MTGKSHIVMGAVSAGIIAETLFLGLHTETKFYDISRSAVDFLSCNFNISTESSSISLGYALKLLNFAIAILIPAFVYLLGNLLPDIDHENSMIGKIIYIPIKHRTWTHTIYFPAALWIAGIFSYRLLFYLGTGMFFHDFWDSFSYLGTDWLYPKKNKHHILKLYHTGSPSEYIFVGIWLTVFIFYTAYVFCSIYVFKGINLAQP
jgi:membrane-bound metal-dependent hydrolase YbcI (DUF457 family)